MPCLFSSCKVTNFNLNTVHNDVDTQKGGRLSFREFLARIQMKAPCNDNLNLRCSRSNLPLHYESLPENLGTWWALRDEVFKERYGKRDSANKGRASPQRQFCHTVADAFPGTDSVIISRNCKVRVSMKGMSKGPTVEQEHPSQLEL